MTLKCRATLQTHLVTYMSLAAATKGQKRVACLSPSCSPPSQSFTLPQPNTKETNLVDKFNSSPQGSLRQEENLVSSGELSFENTNTAAPSSRSKEDLGAVKENHVRALICFLSVGEQSCEDRQRGRRTSGRRVKGKRIHKAAK